MQMDFLGKLPSIVFGEGQWRSSLIGNVFEIDGATSFLIGANKNIGRSLLNKIGVPCPPAIEVSSLQDAKKSAALLGYPVALKHPLGSNSESVVHGIRDSATLATAWGHLRHHFGRGTLIVERMFTGAYFRALVIDGVCVRVSSGRPDVITGNGVKKLKNLVPKEVTESKWRRLRLENLLIPQNISLDDTPESGLGVVISPPTTNWVDCTNLIHSLNRDFVERIGLSMGRSVLGVDIVCSDIGRPFSQGEGVIEVNGGGGFWFHNDQEQIAKLLLDRLPGRMSRSRTPIMCVLSDTLGKFRLAQDNGRIRDEILLPGVAGGLPVAWFEVNEEFVLREGFPMARVDVLVVSAKVSAQLVRSALSILTEHGLVLTHPNIKISEEHASLICAKKAQIREGTLLQSNELD
ncbi:hypothetical protein [Paraburkholderia sp. GAS348]|uniref:hypothetical protein n=1 Tax=Paraburkholderia sp. GAS348 TaxID=3035132 RepID=UPI003D1EF5CC